MFPLTSIYFATFENKREVRTKVSPTHTTKPFGSWQICLYIYMMHISEFVFCQTQISVSHISAYEDDFRLKFRGWSN